MDFAGSHYYRINRILLTCLGLWPYYTRTRYVYCLFLFLLLLSGVFFQLSLFITKEYSVDLLLSVYSTTGLTIFSLIHYFDMFISSNKIKKVMEQVRYDWNSLKKEEELKIMHNRTSIGRLFTIILLILVYTTLVLFILIFLTPKILDTVMPLNESRKSRQFLNKMEFFIDREKYAKQLTLYLIILTFICFTMTATGGIVLQMYVQHTCAMFQITSYRIECIVNKSQTKLSVPSKTFNSRKSIIEAVDGHRNAIKFIDTIKNFFSISNLFIIPLGVASISINLYRLCEFIMAKNIGDAIVLILYIGMHYGYMLSANYMGQEIIDYSNGIFKKICNTRWYEAPLNIQKCLMIITYRSIKTCTITIYFGLFLPSLEGFAKLTSTSLSYFMVIYSVNR